MCMAANVPLVESGTAGYLGQVQPILKVRTYSFICHSLSLVARSRARMFWDRFRGSLLNFEAHGANETGAHSRALLNLGSCCC